MKRILLFSLFVLTFSATAAQDDDTSGWPVEQRRMGEPTAPPEGWTFEGTILMTGYAGIHGVQSDWETPRVVVFLSWERDLPGGALSPDGRWYASPYGDIYETETHNVITTVDEIRVYDTQGKREYYSFVLPSHTVFFGGGFGHIYWIDNQILIYPSGEGFGAEDNAIEQINTLTGETTSWEGLFLPLIGVGDTPPYPSPDLTRVISYDYDSGWRIRDGDNQPLPANMSISTHAYDSSPSLAWLPDSSQFVAEIRMETGRQLALYDRNGIYNTTIFTLIEDQYIPSDLDTVIYSMMQPIRKSLVWSPDGRYLAFNVENQPYRLDTNLYIVDLHEQIIVDTCITTDAGLAWSPDGTQLALMAEGYGQRPILVYDLAENQLFIVGYHSGGILAWRTND